jgi:hypothetical protein
MVSIDPLPVSVVAPMVLVPVSGRIPVVAVVA